MAYDNDLNNENQDEAVEPTINPADCFVDLECDLLDFIDAQNIENSDDLGMIDVALRLYRETRFLRRYVQCEEGVHHGCYCNQDGVPVVSPASDVEAERSSGPRSPTI